MNIHEYQAKEILKSYNINVLNGYLVNSTLELESKLRRIETDSAVIKAQIHAGGRGKAGGIKIVKNLTEGIATATELLGKTLITHQTGVKGKKINKVYIEEACEIEKEYYLGFVINRKNASLSLIASSEGGVDIEQTAENNPKALLRIDIDPFMGLKDFHIWQLASHLKCKEESIPSLSHFVKGLYQCFYQKDAELIEINPLVLTPSGDWIALDAKMSFDDNALFRHPEIESLRDYEEEEAKEVEASAFGLSYISLEGNIGCLVNGAGLAMATMDAIELSGGKPANFLDVGGSATEEMVKKAIEITLLDPQVKGIFINIFGGIMKCDTIARGILEAMKSSPKKVPLVVRLEGTRVEEGKQYLKNTDLQIVSTDSMDDGARLIVQLTNEREATHEHLDK